MCWGGAKRWRQAGRWRWAAPLIQAFWKARCVKSRYQRDGRPSPAACAIVLHEPNGERTSQVSILGEAEFLASRRRTDPLRSAGPSAARRHCTSWSDSRSASWRRAAVRTTWTGRSSATRSGCCRRSASSPSSSVNDAADAGAEAASRPTFVAVKTGERQWVAGTQPGGSGRRFAVAEFGTVAPQGAANKLALPASPALCAAETGFEREDRRATGRRKTRTRGGACPESGPLQQPSHRENSGRDFAAWLGSTPGEDSAGGKARLGTGRRDGASAPCRLFGGRNGAGRGWRSRPSLRNWWRLANGVHRLGAADEEGAGAGGRAGCRLKGFPGSDSACAGRRGQGRRGSKGKRSRVNQLRFLCAM